MNLKPEELASLVSTIEVLNTEVAGLRVALLNADKRARWARSVAVIGVVAGIVGATVGIGGVLVGASAKATARDLAATRRENTVASCVQANLTTQRTREALIAGVSVVAQPNPNRTEAESASVDRFVTDYTRNVEGKLPYRDCSQHGVDSYYENPPADPALGFPSSISSTTTTGG